MSFTLERSQAAGLLTAILTPMLIALTMALSWPLFEANPVSIFLFAVVVSAWYGGLAGGLLSLAVSFLITSYFFIEPYYAFGMPQFGNLVRLVTIGAIGVFISIVCEIMQRKNSHGAVMVTERNLAEDEVRQRQAQLTAIIASAMDAIITIDSDQRIILFNAAAEAMFKCSADEAMGEPIDRFIPERFRRDHADHVNKFGKTKVTTRSMSSLGGIFGLRKDGEEFPIEASISQIEAHGKKLYTVILRDVTERERSDQRLRTVIDGAPNGIVMIDGGGSIVLVNSQIEALFAYDRSELLGK